MYPVVLAFIFLGSILVWYFLKHDHGRQLPISSLWMAFSLGILANVLAYILEGRLPSKYFSPTPQVGLGSLLGFYVLIGILEESCKFIPLALLIYHKPYFKEHTDGVIYFAICGLTFGLGENILYTLSFGAKVGLARLIMTPFFHAAGTSILGYYLVNMKITRNKKKFILACMFVPLMHGLYDFGLSSGVSVLFVTSLMISMLFTLAVFLIFMQANDLDKAALAKANISPEVQNFCSNCGKPNADHSIFCEYCGHKL